MELIQQSCIRKCWTTSLKMRHQYIKENEWVLGWLVPPAWPAENNHGMDPKQSFINEKRRLINYKQKHQNYHHYKNQISLKKCLYQKINYLRKIKSLVWVLKSKRSDLFIGLMKKGLLSVLKNCLKLLKKMIKFTHKNKFPFLTQLQKKLSKITKTVITWNWNSIVDKNKKKKKGKNLQNRQTKKKKKWEWGNNKWIMFISRRIGIRLAVLGLIQLGVRRNCKCLGFIRWMTWRDQG